MDYGRGYTTNEDPDSEYRDTSNNEQQGFDEPGSQNNGGRLHTKFYGHVNIVIDDAFPIICPGREFHAELENRRTRREDPQERQRATGLFLLLIFHVMP